MHENESDILALTERFRTEPDFFFEEVLGVELWEKQRQIALSVRDNPRTTVRSCHSAGKTFTMARIALWFLFSHVPSVVITTAPTERQVKNQFWRELRRAHQNARYPLGGKLLKTEYNIDEDHFAIGFSVSEGEDGGDKFQGWHSENILIIGDEASGLHPSVMPAIEGVMAGGNARLVLDGNPTKNTGDFADSWKNPAYNLIHISAFDTPNLQTGETVVPGLVSADWVEHMKRYGTDSDIYRVRVLGLPPKKDADTLIPLERVEAAIGADRERYGYHDVIGVDVARFGDDRTALVRRVGNWAKVLDIIQDADTMQVAGMCMLYLRKYPDAAMHIDITGGLGAGVYDRLKEQEYKDRVRGVNVASKPADQEHFDNIRDEGWHEMGEWLRDAVLEPHDDWVQLAHPKYKISSSGKTKLEGKEDMKKRGVASPDVGDALALTLQRPTEGGVGVVWI